jgi:hypothetical protein
VGLKGLYHTVRSCPFSEDQRLPDHVYAAIDKKIKERSLAAKSKDLMDECANCGKRSAFN